MVTMKHVAEEAQVSIATVSRVINKTGYVSPDLELRVQQAMEKLNYHPSSLARSLRLQETRTIGLLIPELNQPFFATLAFAIERVLFNRDYRTLICSAEEKSEKESAYIEMLLRQRVEGVIIVPTGYSQTELSPLVSTEMALVLLDRDVTGISANRIFSDNFKGAYDGMMHLLELGHRCIGVISAPIHSQPMTHRLNGIRQALADYGISLDSDLIVRGDLQEFDMGYRTAKQLLQRIPRPTAIFALTDVTAVGVMHAATELNLKLPDDLSVMGYDDVPMATYSIPTLTTIAQPTYAMGETAAEQLLAQIEDNSLPVDTITLENQLIVRQSTAPPP